MIGDSSDFFSRFEKIVRWFFSLKSIGNNTIVRNKILFLTNYLTKNSSERALLPLRTTGEKRKGLTGQDCVFHAQHVKSSEKTQRNPRTIVMKQRVFPLLQLSQCPSCNVCFCLSGSFGGSDGVR